MTRRLSLTLVLAALAACAPRAKTTFEAKPQVLEALTCVAVLPFESLADDNPGAGDAFADVLALELLRSGRFQVMDRAESGRILASRGIYLGATVDADTARALGEVLGVQAVLVGAVSEYRFKPARDDRPARPIVGVTTRLLDVKNGDALWGTTFAGSPKTSFFGDPTPPLSVAAQFVAADVSDSLVSSSGNGRGLPGKPCWEAKAQSVLATLAPSQPRATPAATAVAVATPAPTAVAVVTPPIATPTPALAVATPAPRVRRPMTPPQTALKDKMKSQSQFVLEGIAFTTPTGVALAPASNKALTDLAAVLVNYPEVKVRVEGHVDPTDPGPVPLSQKRAEAVVAKLQSLGVPADQVEPKGMGGSKSLFPSFVEAMKAKNRRLELAVITPPPDEPTPVATPAPSVARVKVLASKGKSATAVKLANELKQKGTKITTIANVPEARAATLIYFTAAFEQEAERLAKSIPVPGGPKLTPYKSLGSGVDIVIVVGSDLK